MYSPDKKNRTQISPKLSTAHLKTFSRNGENFVIREKVAEFILLLTPFVAQDQTIALQQTLVFNALEGA